MLRLIFCGLIAGAIFAHATHCPPALLRAANALALKHANDFDSASLITIYFQRDISQRVFSQAMRKLLRREVVILSPNPNSELLFALAPKENWRDLSRIPGVSRVVHVAEANQVEARDGISRSVKAPDSLDTPDLEARWANIELPVRGRHFQRLQSIRQSARERGAFVVMDRRRPVDAHEAAREQYLFGLPTFYADDLPNFPGTVHLPGVALHMNPGSKSLAVRGDLNPLIGYGTVHGHLNKVREMLLFSKYAREDIPRSLPGNQLIDANPELDALRLAALHSIDDYLTADRASNRAAKAKRSLSQYIYAFRQQAGALFPDGFFIKWAEDYATREADTILTQDTFFAYPAVDQFLQASRWLRWDLQEHRQSLAHTSVQQTMVDAETIVGVVNGLLLGGFDVLVQQALPVRQSMNDNVVEFRVDVFQGRVVSSQFRLGLEYYPDEAAAAAAFVVRFLRKLPPSYRYMSAGFDVVQLQDRSFRIIESNAGTTSSFALPDTYPTTANRAISTFLGRQTPLIHDLETAFSGGLKTQAAFIKQNRREPENIDDDRVPLAGYELVNYFRDRMLDDWRTNRRLKPMRRLEALSKESGLQFDSGVDQLLTGAEQFLQREREGDR